MSNVPVVLLLGATGQLGKLIAQKLRNDKSITLRVCARDDNKLSKLRSQFEQAVKLDFLMNQGHSNLRLRGLIAHFY